MKISQKRIDEIKSAWHNCRYMQQMAIIPSDKKTKVGCTILGRHRFDYQRKFFRGCNIKLSESHVFHAEHIALLSCLSEHYQPIEVFVTSTSFEENIHCCLDCRAILLEANPNIICTVFNPDGTVKSSTLMLSDVDFIMETNTGKIDWNEVWQK